MKVSNGFKYEINGWKYISIKGHPYERGVAHGKLLKQEIIQSTDAMKWNLYNDYGFHIDFFLLISNYIFKDVIQDKFPEFYEELNGISHGSSISLDLLVLWNNYPSLPNIHHF